MKIFMWLVTVVLAIIISGFLFLYLSPDYDIRLVRSESMKPAINMGDMIITGPMGGEVQEGTIVTYQRGEELITHRVLSVEDETLITKGDATEDPDPWPVTISDVQGVYLFKIPYIGYLADFVRTRLGWFLVIILPAAALVAFLIWDIFKEIRRRSEPEEVVQKKEVMPRTKDRWD